MQKKKEEIELFLPDALLSIASLPPGSSTDTAFSSVAKGGYGQLSKEFEISLKQLRSKISLEKVLLDLAARNYSAMLRRAANVLSYVFSTNKFSVSAELAEDLLASLELTRERANIFAIHKYTLFAGAVVIPLILSMSVSLSSGMTSILGTVPDAQLVYQVISVYFLFYCAMVSYFSAQVEGKKSLSLVYFPILLALSLITFHALNFIGL